MVTTKPPRLVPPADAGKVGIQPATPLGAVPPRPTPPIEQLTVWRCPKCGRILAKLRLTPGACVEVKCAVCNTLATKEAA